MEHTTKIKLAPEVLTLNSAQIIWEFLGWSEKYVNTILKRKYKAYQMSEVDCYGVE